MYDQKQNCDHWTELLDYKYMTDMIWIIQLIKLFCQTCLYLVYTQKNTICLKNPSNTLKSFKFCCCSVAQLCPTLWDPMDCSMPGFSVLHYLPEFVQTHVHWVSDAIQPSHPLSSPSPPALNLSQHPDLFQWVSSLHQVAKVLKLQLQHQSFQWIFRVDFLQDWPVRSPCCPRDSQESSPSPQFESINTLILSLFFYGPTLTSIHDY